MKIMNRLGLHTHTIILFIQMHTTIHTGVSEVKWPNPNCKCAKIVQTSQQVSKGVHKIHKM